jgi:hypothetical protein
VSDARDRLPAPADPPQQPDLTEVERRRRRAAVFGEVLPETTSDERGEPAGDATDDWLRQQVPPHHT